MALSMSIPFTVDSREMGTMPATIVGTWASA